MGHLVGRELVTNLRHNLRREWSTTCDIFLFEVVWFDHNKVEPVKCCEKRARAAVDAFGAERIRVDANCGFKHLPWEVVLGKLENMREARDRLFNT